MDTISPEEFDRLKKRTKLYEAVLNSIRNGIVITDPEGYVIFFSETYGRFLGKDPGQQVGKFTTDVIENSRMHIVAKTEVPEINHPHRIKGQDMVVQRIPIMIDGKLVAVFGQVMFENVKDLKALARKLDELESKVELYEKELETLRSSKYTINHIVGRSESITELKRFAVKAAKKNAPILLMGESGTGKELFAHAIHHASERRLYPFIRLNCAAIPKDLLEAELFGYESGAFTGAGSKGKPGKFELAHRGSIFLDEISELPLEMQPKLLRVLEEKEIERLGGTRVMKCDFRLIAATHENLEQCVEQGRFRRDLYYRLNVIPLQIPPLKERKEDIPVIAEYLLKSMNKEFGTNIKGLSAEVLNIFEHYDWPGNVRELSNTLERILYSNDFMADENTIDLEHLPLFLRTVHKGIERSHSALLKHLKEDSEREAVLRAIRISDNNKNKAAKMLGIHRTALYKKMKKLNLPLSKN